MFSHPNAVSGEGRIIVETSHNERDIIFLLSDGSVHICTNKYLGENGYPFLTASFQEVPLPEGRKAVHVKFIDNLALIILDNFSMWIWDNSDKVLFKK